VNNYLLKPMIFRLAISNDYNRFRLEFWHAVSVNGLMMFSQYSPTEDHKLNSLLKDLVSGMQIILKVKLLGAYLGGSFAHGGWDHDSDVDFDVVIESDLTDTEISALTVHHTKIYDMGSYWGKHLEGAYFPKDILQNLDRTDQAIWYLDNGSLTFERSIHDNTLVNRWVLREHGLILVGPPPRTWIPPIPDEKLMAEVRQTMQDWGNEILQGGYPLDNRWAQTFAVLMYCRMLHTLVTGEVQSKPAGAAWAKVTLDRTWTALIDDAISARPDQYTKISHPSDPEKIKLTKAFIGYALSEMG
jgi:predicted nucleotidyltransferase